MSTAGLLHPISSLRHVLLRVQSQDLTVAFFARTQSPSAEPESAVVF